MLRGSKPPTTPLDEESLASTMVADRPGAELERTELRRVLDQALDRLRPEYKAAIVLRYQEALSYADLAHVLGVPEGTAKTYVRRARRELAELLANAGYGPP